MRNRCLILLLLPLLTALPAQAQVYKWKDAQGRTVISDTPQPGAGKQAPVAGRPAATGSDTGNGDTGASAPPKSWAEKDLEFRQRQQQKRESAEKAAKEKAEAERQKENCLRAQSQLKEMESGQRISRMKPDGEREYLDEQQRQQEVERARQSVQSWCK
ncbi:DUF4124 domain-containing protein [Azovibrio restrictus]|uniref:DUF4124 domain-containing protein n=1 Tax=Azovibrio restrictus TaxID=146938 RepID=UPI0026E92015|nr:DUF4124 domain-containing protein [Azovibrio restrictus]